MAITDAKVRGLRPQKKRFIEWEDGQTGLGVRVSPAGRKTFIFMYRFQGKARMMSLGIYPQLHLAAARRKVAEAKEKLTQRIDPGKELVESKKAAREAETVSDLAEEYLDKWARLRKRPQCVREDERSLGKDILPFIGNLKAKEITRRDIIKILNQITERRAPIQANRTFSVVSKMFNFALSQGIIDQNPCQGISKPSKENRRERFLTETEIRALWEVLDKGVISEDMALVLKFQLSTAQRRGEVVSAAWENINFENRIWTIPAERSKNRIPHRVPLSTFSTSLLTDIKKRAGDSRWLFPSQRGKGMEKHITGGGVGFAIRKKKESFPFAHWTPHDLRRTAASTMTSIGIPRLTVSKILNHAEAGITHIYDRHSYDREKRQALEQWGRKLESIITGKVAKVVELRK